MNEKKRQRTLAEFFGIQSVAVRHMDGTVGVVDMSAVEVPGLMACEAYEALGSAVMGQREQLYVRVVELIATTAIAYWGPDRVRLEGLAEELESRVGMEIVDETDAGVSLCNPWSVAMERVFEYLQRCLLDADGTAPDSRDEMEYVLCDDDEGAEDYYEEDEDEDDFYNEDEEAL